MVGRQSTVEKFEELKSCIVDQYGKYYINSTTGEKFYVNVRGRFRLPLIPTAWLMNV